MPEKTLTDVMAALYQSEINCGMQSFWDGHWTVWLGDGVNGRKAQSASLPLEQVAQWLHEHAGVHYPDSVYTRGDRNV